MAALLEIDDGTSAWWESPDIWVVPGDDPLGPVGTPVAGEQAYVWARVHNRGDIDVISARVDFWWSNPSVGVTRTLSTLIGSAFVDLPASTTEEVLCLSAWVPAFVNGGHECLVCEVISPADPLPQPPQDVFDARTYHQIAQRNLSVLAAAEVVLALQVGVDHRAKSHLLQLKIETGGELDKGTLASLGLHGLRSASQAIVSAGLSNSANCGATTSTELRVNVARGRTSGGFVHIVPNDRVGDVSDGTYALIRVYQDRDASAPGITYVVVGGKDA